MNHASTLARAVSSETAEQVGGTLGCQENVGLLFQRCAADRWNDKAEHMNHDDRPQQHPTLDYEIGPDTATQMLYRRGCHRAQVAPNYQTHGGQAVVEAHRNSADMLRRKLTKAHHGLIET